MSDLNSFSITGRLTKDATFKQVGNASKKLLTMDVAVNTGWGDNKQTLYIKVNMWGDRGEKILPYLHKGTLVAVTGTLSKNSWTGSDGEERSDLVITTYSVDFYSTSGTKSDYTTGQSNPYTAPVF